MPEPDESEPTGLSLAKKVCFDYAWRVAIGSCFKDGTKRPLIRDWVGGATKEWAVLDNWWREWKWGWPGVVAGVDSCIVVDCDGPAAVSYFRDIVRCEKGWVDGSGLVYRTPGRGGGLHCVWDWPEWIIGGERFGQAKLFVGDGEIQIRGSGHWTLLCGAPRPDLPSGKREYTLIDEPQGGGSRAPRGVLERIIAESSVVSESGGGGGGGLVEVSPEIAFGKIWLDGRKNCLAGLCWYMAIRGWDSDVMWDMAYQYARNYCAPALADSFVESKMKYAIGRAEKNRMQLNAEAASFMERLRGRREE